MDGHSGSFPIAFISRQTAKHRKRNSVIVSILVGPSRLALGCRRHPDRAEAGDESQCRVADGAREVVWGIPPILILRGRRPVLEVHDQSAHHRAADDLEVEKELGGHWLDFTHYG